MKKPVPPEGYIPVFSEEADKISDDTIVNCVIMRGGVWVSQLSSRMKTVRLAEHTSRHRFRHVQIQQLVRWKDEWEWGRDPVETHRIFIYRNGIRWQEMDPEKWTSQNISVITEALNKEC